MAGVEGPFIHGMVPGTCKDESISLNPFFYVLFSSARVPPTPNILV